MSMPRPQIIDSYPPASDSEVRRFEQAIKTTLPDAYVAFLKTTNGGSFVAPVVFRNTLTEVSVEHFFALGSDGITASLEGATLSLRDAACADSQSLVAVAGDGLGNVICLDCKGPKDRVLIFEHETCRVEPITDSFANFLRRLQFEDDTWLVEDDPVFRSVEQGTIETLDELPEEVCKMRNRAGWTALCVAAAARQASVCRFLIQSGADVNQSTPEGKTPLILAATSDAYDATKLLLDYGADINASDKDGSTALIASVRHCGIRVAKELVEFGADVNKQDAFGETALSLCITNLLRKTVAPLLISRGARK